MSNENTMLCGMFMRLFSCGANGHTPDSRCSICGQPIGWGRAYELHSAGIRHIACSSGAGDTQRIDLAEVNHAS